MNNERTERIRATERRLRLLASINSRLDYFAQLHGFELCNPELADQLNDLITEASTEIERGMEVAK